MNRAVNESRRRVKYLVLCALQAAFFLACCVLALQDRLGFSVPNIFSAFAPRVVGYGIIPCSAVGVIAVVYCIAKKEKDGLVYAVVGSGLSLLAWVVALPLVQ